MKLPNTKAALKEYGATQPKRDRLVENVKTDIDVEHWEQEEEDALNKVRQAFYEDTKDRNSLDNCMLLSLKILRAWTGDQHAPTTD